MDLFLSINHISHERGMVMNNQTADDLIFAYPNGELLAEGKTKRVFAVKGRPGLGVLAAKDDITAGDGAKHDILSGKAALATRTTSNVFRLLSACGLPVAYILQRDPTSFVAHLCDMLPYEVVVRREAHGSFLKRHPHISKGHLFPRLVVEFYLKTNGKRWGECALPCDDPLMIYDPNADEPRICLYDPAKPIHGAKPFLVLSDAEVFTVDNEAALFDKMARIARQAFLVLEKAWQLEGRTLVDFKVEFGLTSGGALLLADVIDNDSWRVLDNGAYIDKQAYRDGGALDDVLAKYRLVAELTDRFHLPRQRIILWRGSESDDVEVFHRACEALGALLPQNFVMPIVTCSAHKEPERALATLRRMLQEVPSSVVIAYVGMSNAAGPLLSAASVAPVITVPATVGSFSEDVWSSLRMPSGVPVSTVLSPGNALLAALQILATRNPFFYSLLAGKLEDRLEGAH